MKKIKSMKSFQRTLGLLLVLVLGVCAASATVTNPFEWKSGDASTQYRIPAIVRIDANTLVAFSDLRGINGMASGDVGSGHNSIIAKKSTDNGASWENQITILDCSTQADNFAYGDAAVVYDKESKKILLMCCGGTNGYSKTSTTDTRIKTYKAVLDPNDLKTVEPTEVTSQIYGLFTSNTPAGLFPTSGRMCQSKIIKKGSNYRIYLGLCTTIGAQIIYTDDLGTTWAVLGTAGAQLVNTVSSYISDETKCAELPDGNVWISARYNNDCKSRGFNIFSYNSDFTSGSWATATTANCEATPNGGGFKMSSSRTNGGIILLPARRVSDQKNVYIAVHTIPYGNSEGKDRVQLGINWKVLRDRNDFEVMKGDLDNQADATYPSSKLLTGWNNYTMSEASSYAAYSSIDDNGTTGIDILYEYLPTSTTENPGKFYNQVYNTISLSTITGGKYEYVNDNDYHKNFREKFMKVNVQPVPGKVYLIKARHTASDGTVSEYYLHSNFSVTQQGDVTKTDIGDLTAKAHNGTDVPDPTYYWTLSKDGTNGDLYFSSFNGDGYMGWGGKGTNYYTGGTATTVCCTPLYKQTFKIYGFLHNAWKDSGGTLTSQTGVDGYSLKYDHNGNNRVLLVNHTNTVAGMDGEHEINWSYLTFRSGKPDTGKNVLWTSDLIFTEVSSSTTSDYGTFNQPEFNNTGFPIKFVRSDDDVTNMYENDDYNYYATVKAPFPIVIPSDVTAYQVSNITNGEVKDKVTLTKFDLGTDRTLPRETPVLLMTAGSKGNGETTVTKYVTLGNGKTFTEPDATTGINSATGLAGTLGREVIASTAYNDNTGNGKYMYYVLGKRNGKVALYRLAQNTYNEWAIAKNKAYFKFPLSSSAKAAPASIEFTFGTTGISNISTSTSKENNGKVYTIDGRYVGNSLETLAPGIYIQNGRKVVKQ